MAVRIESDTMGTIEVESSRYWGAQTQRSIQNFPIGVDRYKMSPAIVRALGILKKGAALANAELEQLPRDKADLIVRAAQEVIEGSSTTTFLLSYFKPAPARNRT